MLHSFFELWNIEILSSYCWDCLGSVSPYTHHHRHSETETVSTGKQWWLEGPASFSLSAAAQTSSWRQTPTSRPRDKWPTETKGNSCIPLSAACEPASVDSVTTWLHMAETTESASEQTTEARCCWSRAPFLPPLHPPIHTHTLDTAANKVACGDLAMEVRNDDGDGDDDAHHPQTCVSRIQSQFQMHKNMALIITLLINIF